MTGMVGLPVSEAQRTYVDKCTKKKGADTYFEAMLLADDKSKKVYCYVSSKVLCRVQQTWYDSVVRLGATVWYDGVVRWGGTAGWYDCTATV